ncbi:secreted protein [Yoonia maricola]|uniref:Secreted protein n=1 Tax=Yoonia maricola TaxID=420999 RepID=A0A2M8W1Y1_9RHOB|nr:DUF1501 domain-containing protein [Yoonia maricola]PJI84919.1 secreted protein [Yoonia maricola]
MATRRDFIKSLASAAAAAGVAGAPQFSFAQDGTGRTKTFIKVFQRGGADGLHLFPLYNDPAYLAYRENLAILGPNGSDGDRALSLGTAAAADRESTGIRGMNPNMAAMMDIWDSGNMMLAPSTSFEGSGRSHFDNQRWIGTGARNNIIDGYMNRYMQEVTKAAHPLRGLVAGKTSISTEIRGEIKVPAIVQSGAYDISNSDLDNFNCGDGCDDFRMTSIMEEIASHEVDLSVAEGNIKDNQLVLLESIQDVSDAAAAYDLDPNAPTYSTSSLGRGLKLCAQLLKHDLPLEMAALDWNIGWDTHRDQIDIENTVNPFTDQNKSYNARIAQGAADFQRFWDDLGPALMQDVVVLVGSEFGRTKKENGSVGTDHGIGGAWFAFGGPTRQAVAQDVSTIDDSVVSENYLPRLTSYRDIIGEIMVRHMGMEESLVSTVFPDHTFNDLGLFPTSTS